MIAKMHTKLANKMFPITIPKIFISFKEQRKKVDKIFNAPPI